MATKPFAKKKPRSAAAQSAKSAKPGKFAKPARFAKSGKPGSAAKPGKPGKFAKPGKPRFAKAGKPGKSAKPAARKKPAYAGASKGARERPRKERPAPVPVTPAPAAIAPVPAAPGLPDESRQRAMTVALAGLDKKAEDVLLLDVRGLTSYAEYFVLLTADNERQASAIADEIDDRLSKEGAEKVGAEGHGGRWVLIDYGDVVAHVFSRDARGFYDLEGLWADATRIPVQG